VWGYNSKPLHECTEHLNGRSAPGSVRWSDEDLKVFGGLVG